MSVKIRVDVSVGEQSAHRSIEVPVESLRAVFDPTNPPLASQRNADFASNIADAILKKVLGQTQTQAQALPEIEKLRIDATDSLSGTVNQGSEATKKDLSKIHLVVRGCQHPERHYLLNRSQTLRKLFAEYAQAVGERKTTLLFFSKGVQLGSQFTAESVGIPIYVKKK